MSRIDILTRLATILRRLDELADLAAQEEENASKSREEVSRLHNMWKDLSQQLRRLKASNQLKD